MKVKEYKSILSKTKNRKLMKNKLLAENHMTAKVLLNNLNESTEVKESDLTNTILDFKAGNKAGVSKFYRKYESLPINENKILLNEGKFMDFFKKTMIVVFALTMPYIALATWAAISANKAWKRNGGGGLGDKFKEVVKNKAQGDTLRQSLTAALRDRNYVSSVLTKLAQNIRAGRYGQNKDDIIAKVDEELYASLRLEFQDLYNVKVDDPALEKDRMWFLDTMVDNYTQQINNVLGKEGITVKNLTKVKTFFSSITKNAERIMNTNDQTIGSAKQSKTPAFFALMIAQYLVSKGYAVSTNLETIQNTVLPNNKNGEIKPNGDIIEIAICGKLLKANDATIKSVSKLISPIFPELSNKIMSGDSSPSQIALFSNKGAKIGPRTYENEDRYSRNPKDKQEG